MAAAVSFSYQTGVHNLFMLLCCSSSIWSLATSSISFTSNFSHPDYDARDLSFQGDAYYEAHSRMIQLTPSIGNSVGRAFLATPVPLWDAVTGELARFTTSFTFQIKANKANTGDGLAFFLGHYPPASIPRSEREMGGGNLGLFDKSVGTVATGDDRVVADEFDTYLNDGFDASGSHMGIDINSIVSRAYTNAIVPGRDLTSGLPMTCNITYGNDTKILAALLQIGDTTYRVNTTIDLRQFLPNLVAIGFSGATGVAVELHQIVSWSFESTLDPPRESPGSRPPTPKTLLPVEIITGPVIGVIAIVCIFVGVRRWQLFARKKRYKALARGLATNEFAEENKLGQGGFACVYKGQLVSTSRPAAIKRFKQTSSGKGRKAFEDELKMASRPRHRNRPCRIDRLVLRLPEEPG
uniref:Protein kinase domain-containing protein n=1 Tax=Hordeum vulgare subsp. vulgare TaxID=112509 RepID=A0A8I6X0Q4_HORVV